MGQGRLELPTSRLSGVYSNQLSYWPSPTYETVKGLKRTGECQGGRDVKLTVFLAC